MSKLGTRHHQYWRKTRWLSALLLVAWAIATFGSALIPETLNQYSILGFPLGFYLFAQGLLLFYLLLIGIYVRVMNRLDHQYGVAENPQKPH